MQTVGYVAVGLLGLSFIVLIHELGHFLAAKSCKVHVERLCLFLGKPIISWKWGNTEFAIAWIPLGGYCKMKDEGLFLQEYPKSAVHDVNQPNEFISGNLSGSGKSFQEVHSLQKIWIAVAGPLVNIVFSFLIFFFFELGGYPELHRDNRIVVLNTSEIQELNSLPQRPSPAEEAGLKSGDIIVHVENKEIKNFEDLRLAFILNPGKQLKLKYSRNGEIFHSTIRPVANREGIGWIGIAPWTDLVVQNSYDSGIAKVQPGMRLEKLNDQPVANWYDLLQLLQKLMSASDNSASLSEDTVSLQWRNKNGELVLQNWDKEKLSQLRFLEFEKETWVHSANLGQAILKSIHRLQEMLSLQIEGLKQLLNGRLRWRDNLAGPIRISDHIGQVIAGPGSSFVQRWYSSWQFLGFISFMIALTNLLPLAVLDGGQIFLYSIELIMGKRLPTRVVSIYQMAGSFFLIGLMIFILGFEFIYYLF